MLTDILQCNYRLFSLSWNQGESEVWMCNRRSDLGVGRMIRECVASNEVSADPSYQ